MIQIRIFARHVGNGSDDHLRYWGVQCSSGRGSRRLRLCVLRAISDRITIRGCRVGRAAAHTWGRFDSDGDGWRCRVCLGVVAIIRVRETIRNGVRGRTSRCRGRFGGQKAARGRGRETFMRGSECIRRCDGRFGDGGGRCQPWETAQSSSRETIRYGGSRPAGSRRGRWKIRRCGTGTR